MAGHNPMPSVVYYATPAPTQGYGLYAAATVFDSTTPTREIGGVDIWPYNCDTGWGTTPVELCWDDIAEAPTKSSGERAAPEHFAPIIAYGASECQPGAGITEDEVMGRARHNRDLHEQQLVESALATRMLTDAGAPATAATTEEALGMLEEWLGEQGYNGYIHAARRFSARSAGFFDDTARGGRLMTHLDNTWVFGGGYASVLGNTMVATGPLYVWRALPNDNVTTTGSHLTPAFNNSIYALSERVIVAGYECSAYAVTVTG